MTALLVLASFGLAATSCHLGRATPPDDEPINEPPETLQVTDQPPAVVVPLEHHGVDLGDDTDAWLANCHRVIDVAPATDSDAQPDWLHDWHRGFRNTSLAVDAANAELVDAFDALVADLHTEPDWLRALRDSVVAAEVRAVIAEAEVVTDHRRAARQAAGLEARPAPRRRPVKAGAR